jgi:hypothetical protein
VRRILKYEQTVTLHGEDGEKLRVSHDNRGEPFRKGVSIWLESGSVTQGVFIEQHEGERLRDLFNLIFPRKNGQ